MPEATFGDWGFVKTHVYNMNGHVVVDSHCSDDYYNITVVLRHHEILALKEVVDEYMRNNKEGM